MQWEVYIVWTTTYRSLIIPNNSFISALHPLCCSLQKLQTQISTKAHAFSQGIDNLSTAINVELIVWQVIHVFVHVQAVCYKLVDTSCARWRNGGLWDDLHDLDEVLHWLIRFFKLVPHRVLVHEIWWQVLQEPLMFLDFRNGNPLQSSADVKNGWEYASAGVRHQMISTWESRQQNHLNSSNVIC